MLQVNLPEEFEEEFKRSIRGLYQETIQQAQNDYAYMKEFLTIQETCELLQVSRKTLTTNFLERGLPLYKIESKQYLKKSEINQFIEKHQI